MSARALPVSTPSCDRTSMFPTLITGVRSTGPPALMTSMNFAYFLSISRMSLTSPSVSLKSPFSGILSFPSPDILESTYIPASALNLSGILNSGSFITIPMDRDMTLTFSALALCFSSSLKASLASSLQYPYTVSQSLLYSSKPALMRPSSTFTKYLEFTSPDPVPPLIVFLTPLPTASIVPAFSSGNAPFFFSITVHPPRYCLSLPIFSLSYLFIIVSFSFRPGDLRPHVLQYLSD